jgi:SagB-type dehydrogenase family enzyme
MRLFNSAKQYHHHTRYSFNAVKEVYREAIPDTHKLLAKDYRGRNTIDLPTNFNLDRGNLAIDFEKSMQFREFQMLDSSGLSVAVLSLLLYASNGVTLKKKLSSKTLFFRASPSASSTYPIEIYVVANAVDNLNQGLYYYHPLTHRLVELLNGNLQNQVTSACFNIDSMAQAPLYFLFSGTFSRNTWRFKDRALRYSFLEAGYILQNLALAAASLGLHVNIIGDFIDSDINQILQLDVQDEVTLAVAAIGKSNGYLATETYWFSMPGQKQDTLESGSGSVQNRFYEKSSHDVSDKNILNVQVNLPFKKTIEERSPEQNVINLPDLMETPRNFAPTLKVIENRRSAHFFSRISISLDELSNLLYLIKKIPALYNFPAYHIYLVVNDVENLVNGLYAYFPKSHQLQLIKKGTFRGDISYLTLAQDAVFNCSVAFFFAVDFDEIDIFSNRGYRYAHFNIGMLSEALYIAASAMGLAVRGISNFFDDEMNNFFRFQKLTEIILGGVIVGQS